MPPSPGRCEIEGRFDINCLKVGATGCLEAACCCRMYPSSSSSMDLVLCVDSLLRWPCIPRIGDDGVALFWRLFEFIRDGGSSRRKLRCDMLDRSLWKLSRVSMM